MKKTYKYLFKVIFIGDSGVGKSSIVQRFTENLYKPNIPITIGVDFKIKTLEIDNEIVKLQIWDTAGQEKYSEIVSNYYRGSNGVLIVFDVTNDMSIKNVVKWLKDFKKKNSIKEVQSVILGNKIDLLKDSDKNIHEEISNKLENAGLENFDLHLVSAFNNHGIDEVFEKLTRACIENFKPFNATLFSKKRMTLKEDDNTCC